MWGSDVTSLEANQPTTQEWINTNRGQKLHSGRKDLVLNGPIDNPAGSCTACHGFAQIARVNSPTPTMPGGPPAVGATGTALDRYFTNVKTATTLSPDYVSVEYSLQLQLGISRAINAPRRVCRPASTRSGARLDIRGPLPPISTTSRGREIRWLAYR